MSVYADLHVHTDASDGTLSLSALPAAARAAGVRVLAVTDHDRRHPGLSAPVERRDGVTLLAGIELRVDSPAGRVDLLGYAAKRTPDLRALVDGVQADRVARGRAIVDCVEDRLGVALDVTVGPGFGRPHVARAVASHPALSYTVAEVFEDLIGEGRPCYVRRDVPDFEAAVAVLDGACSLVGLAHPLRYADPPAALSLCADLDAVERVYPYETGVDTGPVDAAVRDHDLVPTGGSDAHGDTVGVAGLDRDAHARVAGRLGS
jgi:predicted metal-dependent phosphoesterase TrpH